jgi:LmbE family N-acetylglucosaminyl deacetylase
MACLGLHYEHKDFLDAIYRRQAGGSWLLSGGRPPWHRPDRPEPDLAADLAIAMRAAIEKVAPQLVLTCAAIGNHTDHVLTRNAVIQAVSGTRISLDLWEDLPYGLWASQIPRLPAEAVVGARITEPATDAVWDRKYRAIECYASQEGLLWGGRDFRPELDRHERSLDAHPSKRRTEAFWRIRRGPVERAPVQLAAAQPPHDHAMTRS